MTRSAKWSLAGAILVVLLGAALRLAFLLVSHPHVDEYSSIWAAMRVWRSGLPILPSGFPYLQGFLFTYVDAPFAGAVPFSPALARLPSLIAGVVTIALVFAWGRSLFGSFAGLLGATLVALESASVVWGGRARMYALQQMLLTLALYAFFRGIIREPDDRRQGRWRLVFALAFAGAVLSQTTTVLVAPGLVLALLLVRDRLDLGRPGDRLLGLFVALSLLLAIGLNAVGGPVSDSSQRAFLDPALPWRIKPEAFFRDFFWSWPGWLRTLPLLASSAWLFGLWRSADRRKPENVRLACLVALVVGSLAPMIFLVGESWQRPRYLIMLLPAADLLAGAVIAGIGRRIASTAGSRVAGYLAAAAWVGVVAAFAPSALAVVGPAEPGYDLAYRYVAERAGPDDAIVSPLPPISGVYLGRSNGYALTNGYEEYVIDSSDGQVDRWTGSPLIDSPAELNRRFPYTRRVWFVVDDVRWNERYDDAFRSHVERSMQTAYRGDAVTVYERPAQGK